MEAKKPFLERAIMISKTLILSQITHLFAMTFTQPSVSEQLDKSIFNFLWKGKPPRIKRETIIAPIEDGGLWMPDIHAFHQAQKTIHIKNLVLENAKSLNLFFTCSGFEKSLLKHKPSDSYLEKLVSNAFHAQVLKCWFDSIAKKI